MSVNINTLLSLIMPCELQTGHFRFENHSSPMYSLDEWFVHSSSSKYVQETISKYTCLCVCVCVGVGVGVCVCKSKYSIKLDKDKQSM